MSVITSVRPPEPLGVLLGIPDTPSELVGAGFPSPQLVSAAAGLFERLPAWDGREGPRRRIIISPGSVRIARRDPAKAERSLERDEQRRHKGAHLSSASKKHGRTWVPGSEVTGGTVAEQASKLLETWVGSAVAEGLGYAPGTVMLPAEGSIGVQLAAWRAQRRISDFSRKSRTRMRETLASLDWSGFFDEGAPAMVTLTYPGDWESVAGRAKLCKGHIDALKKRYQRKFGKPLRGVWKREFQRRGAPHYHIYTVVPPGFHAWLVEAWTEVVGHPDPVVRDDMRAVLRHPSTVDRREGAKASDPKRLATYFAKHGLYAEKDYQNHAPAQWLIGPEGIGRFWGVWGLEKALGITEISDQDGDNAARVMRRWSRANGFRAQRTVWRTDTKTGEQKPRRSGCWVSFMPRSNGMLIVNDGPAFASQLSRAVEVWRN